MQVCSVGILVGLINFFRFRGQRSRSNICGNVVSLGHFWVDCVRSGSNYTVKSQVGVLGAKSSVGQGHVYPPKIKKKSTKIQQNESKCIYIKQYIRYIMWLLLAGFDRLMRLLKLIGAQIR